MYQIMTTLREFCVILLGEYHQIKKRKT